MAIAIDHYYGRFMLGEHVGLSVQCLNASNVPTNPAAAPLLNIYNTAGTAVLTDADQKVPPKDVGKTTGLFEYSLFLDSQFSVGIFVVHFAYTISASRARLGVFEVLAGGDDKGPYTSMHWYHPPHSKFIVGETADGTTEDRRNPYV